MKPKHLLATLLLLISATNGRSQRTPQREPDEDSVSLVDKLQVEGDMKINGESYFSGKAYFNRITSLPGDTVLFLGDSSIVINSGQHQIYNDFYLLTTPPAIKGLGIGHFQNNANGEFSLAMGRYVQTFGNYSINLGNNLRTLTSATNSIVIGSGISSSSRLTNAIANSLMVGFNSNKPTLFVGPSAGLNTTGNVGISTQTPEDKFQVNVDPYQSTLSVGSAFYENLNWGNVYLGFNAVRQSTGWKTYSNGSDNGGGIIYSNHQGSMYFITIPDNNSSADQTDITDQTVRNNTKLFIDGTTGNIGIGTFCIPGGYKMAIDGRIICEEVLVKLSDVNGCWPDYVFDSTYQLKPLNEVELYIKENNHLPEVPSQAEVHENGLTLAEMSKIQMKKIEELTLYMIELSKKVEKLEVQNKKLQDELNQKQ